jgi:hypothetical protein
MDTTKMKTPGSLLTFKHAPKSMLRLILSKEYCIAILTELQVPKIQIQLNDVFTLKSWMQIK